MLFLWTKGKTITLTAIGEGFIMLESPRLPSGLYRVKANVVTAQSSRVIYRVESEKNQRFSVANRSDWMPFECLIMVDNDIDHTIRIVGHDPAIAPVQDVYVSLQIQQLSEIPTEKKSGETIRSMFKNMLDTPLGG